MDDLALRVASRFNGSDGIELRVAARFQRANLNKKWEDKFLGRDCRLQWDRHSWLLEELPIKGKKKLKVATLDNPETRGGDSPFLDGNILRDAKLSHSDPYEVIKQKILDAYAIAADIRIQKLPADQVKHYQWLRDIKWYENELHYLKVPPEDTEPFVAEGKDFKLKTGWTDFSVYSPQSDFQQTQPFYMGYKASSPTDARKLYQILKADPNTFKNMDYNELSAWFTKNKIKTRSDHSSWT